MTTGEYTSECKRTPSGSLRVRHSARAERTRAASPAPHALGRAEAGVVRGGRSAAMSASVVAAAAARGRVRVATYNVLSQTLARGDHFASCAPAALDPAARLERVKAKLEDEVERGSVVCLQEVSMSWAGELHTFFDRRGYTFLETLYSSPFSDYMGVGLAVPRERYELAGVQIKRIADAKAWPAELDEAVEAEGIVGKGKRKRRGGVGGVLKGALRLPIRLWRAVVGGGSGGDGSGGAGPPAWMAGEKKKARSAYQHWLDSRRRNNRAIGVRLRDVRSSSEFVVATYHMPCMFWDLKAMTIHSALVGQWAQGYADGAPLCLAGDFNIKPGDPAYDLLTQGDLDEASEGYPTPVDWEPWRPKLQSKFDSAYLQVDGREPDFTNYAKIKEDEPFIDTLDYLFVGNGMRATAALPLAHRDDVDALSFPTEDEPSDHVLIAADMEY